MKKQLFTLILCSSLLASCQHNPTSPSVPPSPSLPSVSINSNKPSTSSSASNSVSTPTEQVGEKASEDSAEGLATFLALAGQKHNYMVSFRIKDEGDPYVFAYTENYMTDENSKSGIVLVPVTDETKALYRFDVDDSSGNVVLSSAVINSKENVPYQSAADYDVLSSMTKKDGTYNSSSYPFEKLKKKDGYYQTNDSSYITLLASLFGASSIKNKITRFTLSLVDDLSAVEITCYTRKDSSSPEFVLFKGKVYNVSIAKSEELDQDLIEARLPESKLDAAKVSSYVGKSYAFASDFYIGSENDFELSSTVTTSFDGTDFKAVVRDSENNPTGFYHFIDKNNETYQSYVNGYNKVVETPVSKSDGSVYPFDEYIYAPEKMLDPTYLRKIDEHTYRYLGFHADDIFLSFTFNEPSNFGYVDQLDFIVNDKGEVDYAQFVFTGLQAASGDSATLKVKTKAVSVPVHQDFGPFANENPRLENAINLLKTTSFEAKGVADIRSGTTVLTPRKRVNYRFDATSQTLLVERFMFDTSDFTNYIDSRKAYRQVGDTLHYYSLSTKDRTDGKYDVLQHGYTKEENIASYLPITGSSKVFSKKDDDHYVGELFSNPSDAFDFGEVLTNYYPYVNISLKDGKIDTMSARYVLSSTYSMICIDRVSFSYHDVTLGEFVE